MVITKTYCNVTYYEFICILPTHINLGQWDAEPFYYIQACHCEINSLALANGARNLNLGLVDADSCKPTSSDKRLKRGVAYRSREIQGNEYECFQSHCGVIYRPGDQVLIFS